MTTLASAVSIGDNQLLINAPLAAGQIPGWVKIDTEMLYAGGQHFRTGTTLTLSAPATATHSNGATVTYAGRPYDADFRSATGGGGGGAIAVDNTVDAPFDASTFIALGAVESAPGEATLGTVRVTSYPVEFDDADLTGASGKLVTLIPANTLVLGCKAFVQTQWEGATFMEIRVGAGDPGWVFPLAAYDLTTASSPQDGITVDTPFPLYENIGALLTAEGKLRVKVVGDPTPTAGVSVIVLTTVPTP